jgi:hypothetical protein
MRTAESSLSSVLASEYELDFCYSLNHFDFFAAKPSQTPRSLHPSLPYTWQRALDLLYFYGTAHG